MGRKKSRGKGGDRVVYSEFGQHDEPEAEVVDLPPTEQKITVQATRKGRGGKTVTIASGFQHAPATLKALLKAVKGKCGTGGTVKDATLEIQGDAAAKVAEVLKNQGYTVKISGKG
ncbi:MAG: translation initiation factor [Geitlerinemataceae cyanobacterium]